ncbi:MAG: Nitroreductase [Parcubacteria group bacterium]|nr:Nitroreductase [Parcubacteria group bacterium]
MEEIIRKILEESVHAPSGENCQPWKFAVDGSSIHIFNVPEADTSLYNFEQKGSYAAHGALIENIVIAALKYGYKATVKLFLIKEEPNLVATLMLDSTNPRELPLYPFIAKRCTNRRDHAHQKLSDDQKKQLIESAKETGLGELKIIDDEESLNTLGKALSVNEQIIFENKKLHNFFYEHILWNEEDQGKAGGFYIKTLEFLPHQLKGVKLFKNWIILKILNKIGKVSRMIAKENAEKYANSGALAVVIARGNTREDFVNAGRTAEKVWLKATELGLSAHPCTGVIYLMERIKGGDAEVFNQSHLETIKTAYSDIERTFGVSGKTIPMLFRIGFADEPSARSMRMKPNILFSS